MISMSGRTFGETWDYDPPGGIQAFQGESNGIWGSMLFSVCNTSLRLCQEPRPNILRQLPLRSSIYVEPHRLVDVSNKPCMFCRICRIGLYLYEGIWGIREVEKNNPLLPHYRRLRNSHRPVLSVSGRKVTRFSSRQPHRSFRIPQAWLRGYKESQFLDSPIPGYPSSPVLFPGNPDPPLL